MDVIGGALQIIEVIQVIRGVYVRVKGLGKEVEDAMADCLNMQADIEELKKLFNKQTSTKFPKQQSIIVQEFQSLHRSMKKLKKIFKEYERISQKLFGNFAWAYSKPRATILAMREDFASYRGIFQKALLIINEGHNQDQAKTLKELKDQAKKASDERKDMINRLKAMDKKADERSKKDREIYTKKIDELVKKNQATAENRSKVFEQWLVEEKGSNKEDAKKCASTALKEGRVPSVKMENKDSTKKVGKETGSPGGNGKVDGSRLKSTTKKVEKDSPTAKVSVGKDSKNESMKPKQKSEAKSDKEANPTSVTNAKTAEDRRKSEKPANMTAEKNNGKPNEVKKPQILPPMVEGSKAPVKQDPRYTEKKDKTPNLATKNLPTIRKPKVPVIVVQDTNDKKGTKNKDNHRSPSPTSNSSARSSLPSNISVLGRRKPRAASVSSESSAKSQRERIEKTVRYVKGSGGRARSQDPPQTLAVGSFERVEMWMAT